MPDIFPVLSNCNDGGKEGCIDHKGDPEKDDETDTGFFPAV